MEVDNLGVIAYNLPQQLGPLRDWKLPANDVVYLFYYNDFGPPMPELMSVNGYPIRRRHPDGTLVSDEEAQAMGQRVAREVLENRRVSLALWVRLPRVRRVVRDAWERFSNRRAPTPVNWGRHEKDQTRMVPRSLEYTFEMRDLAVARNMKFYIAIVPAVEEVRDGKHFPQVTEYIEGLRAAGLTVLDLLPRLSPGDYLSFDPHFNAKGAKVAADEIYKTLNQHDTRAQ